MHRFCYHNIVILFYYTIDSIILLLCLIVIIAISLPLFPIPLPPFIHKVVSKRDQPWVGRELGVEATQTHSQGFSVFANRIFKVCMLYFLEILVCWLSGNHLGIMDPKAWEPSPQVLSLPKMERERLRESNIHLCSRFYWYVYHWKMMEQG